MTETKSQRSLTQIIKKNQINDLTSKINYLEEELKNKEILLINLEKCGQKESGFTYANSLFLQLSELSKNLLVELTKEVFINEKSNNF